MKSSFNAEYDRKNDIFMGTSTEKLISKWENQKWFEALNTFLFQRLDNVSTIIIHSTTINDACSNGKSTEYQTNSKKNSVSSCQYLTRLKLNLIVP